MKEELQNLPKLRMSRTRSEELSKNRGLEKLTKMLTSASKML
jgi:hypothetical protein